MKSNNSIKGWFITTLLIIPIILCGYDNILTARNGRILGMQDVETWYNLPMDGVVKIMRERGYCDADYPYYIRNDGVKMLGDFVICAGDFQKYYRGQVVYTTLGQGIICDTGEDLDGLDIAVDWR